MKTSELQFELPPELVAQTPVDPRDHCRLMVLDRQDRAIRHDQFFDLGDYLKEGDVLVFNQSKVLPARLIGRREGSKREVLLLKDLGGGDWQCLVGGKIQSGDNIHFAQGLQAEVQTKGEGTATLRFTQTGLDFLQTIQKIGLVPTPPYIKQFTGNPDLYQTVYASKLGSAAAPTAGLHFTQHLLDELKAKGVQQEFVTLHVGLGTFQPIKTEDVEEHPIHSEYYEIEPDVLSRLKKAKEEGRRIIAVGTTSVRVLETVFSLRHSRDDGNPGDQSPVSGETSIFIYPGYQFKAVDALITNFHTPGSSLLALVYALAGQDFINEAYHEAIAQKYRFFSFGDAMLIL